MSVGDTLTRARQDRGLSVEDVTAATRIRSGLVRAIEADDFTPCGGAVYARGHIRSISRVLGIDAEPLVAQFDREHADEVAPMLTVQTPPFDPEAANAEPKRANWAAAMAVALVAICVLAAVSLVTGHGGSSKTTADNRHTPSSSGTPSPSSQPTAPPSVVAQVPSNVATALVRVVSDRTWLQVWTIDGHELFQGILSKGDTKVFKNSRGLRLLIGNAPAVDLVANGRDLGSPRAQGNVAHVTIQRGNVQFA